MDQGTGAPQQPGEEENDLEANLEKLATKLFATQDGNSNMKFLEEMEARCAELEARLSLAEESKNAALKERDAATEARQKVEKTLAEFLQRFASVRETQTNSLRELEQARNERAANEKLARESAMELDTLRQSTQALTAERDTLQRQLAAAEQQIGVLRAEVAEVGKAKTFSADALNPLLSANERSIKTMTTSVEDLLEQIGAIREELVHRIGAVENVASYLSVQMGASQRQLEEQVQALQGDQAGQAGAAAVRNNGVHDPMAGIPQGTTPASGIRLQRPLPVGPARAV